MVDETEPPHLFETRYRDAVGWFHTVVDHRHRATTRFHGRGTMDGARAFVAALDDAVRAVGSSGHAFFGLVDLSDLEGTPLRAQLSIGKWLFGHKKHFARIAVFGGKAWEMNLAKAIMKIAGMDRVAFFATEATATAWLEAGAKPDAGS